MLVGADDHRSMAADNTSAFNCRFVAGSDGVWSEHAYGRALDLNPLENPYVTESGYVSPPAGAPFADRSRHRRGMVHRGGPVGPEHANRRAQEVYARLGMHRSNYALMETVYRGPESHSEG